MKIELSLEEDPNDTLIAIDGDGTNKFPDLILGDSLPIEIYTSTITGTLPSYWGNAEYVFNLGIGNIETRQKYAETGNMPYIDNGYKGKLQLTSSDLVSLFTDVDFVVLSIQIAVTNVLGDHETILNEQVRINKAVIE